MKLAINGEDREFRGESLAVVDVLQQLALGYPVVVEWNGQALFEREFPETQLSEGDRLELFRMVAGG